MLPERATGRRSAVYPYWCAADCCAAVLVCLFVVIFTVTVIINVFFLTLFKLKYGIKTVNQLAAVILNTTC